MSLNRREFIGVAAGAVAAGLPAVKAAQCSCADDALLKVDIGGTPPRFACGHFQPGDIIQIGCGDEMRRLIVTEDVLKRGVLKFTDMDFVNTSRIVG